MFDNLLEKEPVFESPIETSFQDMLETVHFGFTQLAEVVIPELRAAEGSTFEPLSFIPPSDEVRSYAAHLATEATATHGLITATKPEASAAYPEALAQTNKPVTAQSSATDITDSQIRLAEEAMDKIKRIHGLS